ncbi:MAG: ABC transporter permease [Lachnospiraceae bacterium]|nr:ABC transporter permease [Lachnospiraceae bacterium]
MAKTKSEPLFHIAKRADMTLKKAILIRVVAIVAALILCAIITMITTGLNPLSVYGSMANGAFGTVRKSWITAQDTSILLLIALALTPAFKMKFWNIGGEGQVLVGALATSAVMLKLAPYLPHPALVAVMLVAAILAGGIWGVLPAICKAKWNTNETLFTLMMNYIATQLTAFYIIVWEYPKGAGKVGIINADTELGWLPRIGNFIGGKYVLTIFIAVLTTVAMFAYLYYSKQGYEICVVGESENTARYVGINVGKVIIRTMFISGAICGLTGFILVAGVHQTITTSLVGGQGFTAVMVSWLAKFNPLIMIFASLLIVFLKKGAGEVASSCGLNESFSEILTGIIIFFIIGCEFFIRYKIVFNKKSAKGGNGNV